MNEPPPASLEWHDRLLHWRCPQLGGEVPFRYCRTLLGGLPCARLVSCWHTLLDVEAFLTAHYDPAALAGAWSQPTPDILSQLPDLIQRAAKADAKQP